MKQRLVFTTACMCFSALFGKQADCDQKPSKPTSRPAKQIPNPLQHQLPLYETYDNIGWANVGVRADILYMIYNSSILTFASNQSLNPSATVLTSDIVTVPGKLSLGCNLALTYTLPSQPGYTFESSWFHIVARFGKKDVDRGLVPAHSVALTRSSPGSATVNAQIAINLFDAMVMKRFAFGDWFTITPGAGLVGGYMNTHNRAFYSANGGNFGSSTTHSGLVQHFKYEGIGAKVGGRSTFRIWDRFKFNADFFYNTLYGYGHGSLSYTSNGSYNGLNAANSTYRNHFGRTFFDTLLGLSWDYTFNQDSLYLELHAAWRFQSFSSGWREFEAEFNDALHDLTLNGQGLQAGATFKF